MGTQTIIKDVNDDQPVEINQWVLAEYQPCTSDTSPFGSATQKAIILTVRFSNGKALLFNHTYYVTIELYSNTLNTIAHEYTTIIVFVSEQVMELN